MHTDIVAEHPVEINGWDGELALLAPADYRYNATERRYDILLDGHTFAHVHAPQAGGWHELAAMRALRVVVCGWLARSGYSERIVNAAAYEMRLQEADYADSYQGYLESLEHELPAIMAAHEAEMKAACEAMGRAEFAPAPAPTFTREHVGQALKQMRRHAQNDKRLGNAINRAALNIEACPWYFRQDGVFVVESASTTGLLYHVSVTGHCDCPAHGRCWHQIARELLTLAQSYADMEQVNQPAPLSLPIVVIPARVPLAA